MWMSARRVAFSLAVGCVCLWTAPAVADTVVLVDQNVEVVVGSGQWLEALGQGTKEAVRFGGFEPWQERAKLDEDLAKAEAVHQKGVDAFLELNMREASTSFKTARNQYESLLQTDPYSTPAFDGMARSAFYQVWAQLEGRKRNQARRGLQTLLSRYPGLSPDPGTFPPAFRQEVEDARKKVAKDDVIATLTLQASPNRVLVSVGGQVLDIEDGQGQVVLPRGKHKLQAAWPGVAEMTMDVDLSGGDLTQKLDFLGWPDKLPQTRSGWPAAKELLSELKTQGVGALIWVTDASPLDMEGQVVYVHDLDRDQITGAVAFTGGVTERVMGQHISLLNTILKSSEPDFYTVERGEAALDTDLRDSVMELLGEEVTTDDPPPVTGKELKLRLGLDVGTGLGLATQVTDPGLAPTLLFIRPDISVGLNPSFDLGVAGRFQVINFAALGELYARWHLSEAMKLRFGLGIGQITQKIFDTENRNTSTEGLVGPSLGLEIPLGPVNIGATLLAPLFPDTTIQGDIHIGVAFDL